MSVPSDKKNLTDTSGSPAETKKALRRTLLDKRRSLDNVLRKSWDHLVCENLLAYQQKHPALSLGIYYPIQGEPDLMPFYASLSKQGVTLSLPVVTDKQGPLQFARWNPDTAMIKDDFGVTTPKEKDFLPLPDALLIPCVGFTHARYRLGYGGGFYDRTLEKAANQPKTIGIAYGCLLTDFSPGTYDIALDVIITEAGLI